MGPQYETAFQSTIRHLEFWGGF